MNINCLSFDQVKIAKNRDNQIDLYQKIQMLFSLSQGHLIIIG